MEDYQPIPSTQLEEVIFNDEQEAKVGAALLALADQIKTSTRCTTQRQHEKEVIELLSDSDCDEVTVISESAAGQAISVKEANVKYDKRADTKDNCDASQQTGAVDSVKKKKRRVRAQQRQASGEINTHYSNNLPKCSTVADFLQEESDTQSAWSDSSDTKYKFKYEQEPDIVEPAKNKETPPNSAAYITLTDITGEEIQVKEINVQRLVNGEANKDEQASKQDDSDIQEELVEVDDDEQEHLNEQEQHEQEEQLEDQQQLYEQDQTAAHLQLDEQQDSLPTQSTQIEYEDVHVDVDDDETLLQAKQEMDFEEPYLQQYCKEEITVKPDYYTNEDASYRNSFDDSNGLHTMYGADMINSYDETDEDLVELSDLTTEQIMIDLVDSETDDEQETTDNNTSNNESLLESKTSSTIECFMNYTCPQCSLECGSYADWKLHTDAVHKFCTIESLNMQTIIDKDGHLRYQCRDCEQKFGLHLTYVKLLPHRLKHLPNEDYIRCRLCDTSARNKGQMRRHLRKMHYKICREYATKPKATRPNVLALKYIRISCPVCNEPQKNREHWQEHLEQMHDFSANVIKNVNLISNAIYKCSVCEVKMRKRSIMDHMLIHEKYKSFACTLCNKYEAGQLMLALTHVRRVHLMSGKELLFKCNYCDATFEKMSHRKEHLRSKHKVKWQKCAICHKEFFSISLLLSHMNFANHHKLK